MPSSLRGRDRVGMINKDHSVVCNISPVVVQDFTQVGITYRGELPRIQGRYYPLSIVVPIHGGEDHRKVGLMPTQVGITNH